MRFEVGPTSRAQGRNGAAQEIGPPTRRSSLLATLKHLDRWPIAGSVLKLRLIGSKPEDEVRRSWRKTSEMAETNPPPSGEQSSLGDTSGFDDWVEKIVSILRGRRQDNVAAVGVEHSAADGPDSAHTPPQAP